MSIDQAKKVLDNLPDNDEFADVREVYRLALEPKKAYKYSERDMKAAEWMWGLVQAVSPAQRAPVLESWAHCIRMMREIDFRSYEEIADMFRWANRHHFWWKNIKSPDKLRAQWDRLSDQMADENKTIARSVQPSFRMREDE